MILFVLVFQFVFPAVLGALDEPELILQPRQIRAETQFTLSFEINTSEAEAVRIAGDVRFPKSAVLIGGPGIYPVTVKNPKTEELEKRVKIQYVFRAVTPGRSYLDPIPFFLEGVPYSTQGLILEISYKNGPFSVPFDLAWRSPRKVLFEGQTSPVYLEMLNLRGITVPETVSVPPPAGAVFEEAKDLGFIQTVPAGKEELFRVPVNSFLVTPSSSARVTLPAARVKAGEVTVASEPFVIDVRPLPEAVRGTGAVGKFVVTSKLEKKEAALGEQLRLSFRVEGEGNLNFLQPPVLGSEDFAVSGKASRSSFKSSEGGCRGFQQWDFRIVPKRLGSIEIAVPPFPWLDPETEEIHTASEKRLVVNVIEKTGRGTQGKTTDGGLKALNSVEIDSYKPLGVYRKAYFYLLLLPGVLGFLLTLLKKWKSLLFVLLSAAVFMGAAGRENETSLLLDSAVAAFEAGDNKKALELFSQVSQEYNPGLHYDLGLVHRALGGTAKAVFHFRKAAEKNPHARLFRSSLALVEKDYGLNRQPALPRFHPDLFLLAFVILFTGTAFLPLLSRRKEKNIIFMALLTIVTLCSLVVFFIVLNDYEAERGIVGPSPAVLRKIPLPNASEWLFLEEGTAVEIGAASGPFVLVRTGFGVEGWISGDKLLR